MLRPMPLEILDTSLSLRPDSIGQIESERHYRHEIQFQSIHSIHQNYRNQITEFLVYPASTTPQSRMFPRATSRQTIQINKIQVIVILRYFQESCYLHFFTKTYQLDFQKISTITVAAFNNSP